MMNIHEIIKFMKPNWHQYKLENDINILKIFNHEFPDDYLIFLKEMGEGSYQFKDFIFSLWCSTSVIQYNKDYMINEYLSNQFIGIGTDGGGICFLLDYRTNGEVKLASIGLGDLDIEEVNILASSFTDALNLIINGKLTLNDLL